MVCIFWSIYVLIEGASQDAKNGQIDWGFYVKISVVTIGLIVGVIFVFVQLKLYFSTFMKWRQSNRIIIIRNANFANKNNNNSNTTTATTTEITRPLTTTTTTAVAGEGGGGGSGGGRSNTGGGKIVKVVNDTGNTEGGSADTGSQHVMTIVPDTTNTTLGENNQFTALAM